MKKKHKTWKELKNEASVPQPPPKKNSSKSIHDLVIEDILARKSFGLEKYGTVLQANNGRDALMDAYQELLDGACYLKQLIEERKPKEVEPHDVDFLVDGYLGISPQPRITVYCDVCKKQIKGNGYVTYGSRDFICHKKCQPRPA